MGVEPRELDRHRLLEPFLIYAVVGDAFDDVKLGRYVASRDLALGFGDVVVVAQFLFSATTKRAGALMREAASKALKPMFLAGFTRIWE